MLSANTVDFGHVCVGSCPSDSGSPCILCKHSTEPKCFSGSHFAQQQFEEQQLTTPCDMLPHINIKRLSEYNESVRVEVSVVNGKEYINKCPVPWQRSDSRKDMNMRLDHQQLHINKYNRKSRTWIQEPKNSMLVGGPEWESPAGGAVYRDIALQPGTQMFELEGFAIQYNGNQTPWRLMVRICLPDSNAIGDPSQYQELAVAVSEAFQANMVTPLPESQLALSSQLIDTEAATTADEFDPARSYLLDNHDPMFPSGGVSDDDDGHGMLFDDSRAAARSNLRLEANSVPSTDEAQLADSAQQSAPAMWEESWAPMAPHKQAARKLLFAMNNEIDGRLSPPYGDILVVRTYYGAIECEMCDSPRLRLLLHSMHEVDIEQAGNGSIRAYRQALMKLLQL
ncbi:hypothetical protein WJX82_010902 [Trebouxia sp. C0006]